MTHPYDSTCPCAACRHTSLALSARRSGMQIPENITKHHGIEASALGQVGADEPAVYCGLDSWRPLIGAALLLLRHTDENVVRIMTGTHTILVMRNAERQAAAVVVTGNPISKSLPRMLRGALNMTKRPRRATPEIQEPAPAMTDPIHAALKAAIEIETTGYLWGQPYTFVPAVCSKVFGDGRALLLLQPLNTRPAYYVVRIDSTWRLGDEEARGAPDLWDFIDDIELAAEAEFGDACEADEDDPDEDLPREWPAFNGNSGCSWARMDWPTSVPAELDPHPFARRNVLSDFRIPVDAPHPSPRPRGAAVTSPVSACDCHLSPRPRPRDLPDPNCPRCLGSGEVTCG